MTQEENRLQERCSAAFEHMRELVDKLPEMQQENGRLQRAENAAAVQVCEKHYLALKKYVDDLYALQKESIARCRKLHETIADPDELADRIRKEGERQAIITNDIAHNDGSAHNKLNEYGNTMMGYFSGEADYRAALLSEAELTALRDKVVSYREDYQKTLQECQELDALLSPEQND